MINSLVSAANSIRRKPVSSAMALMTLAVSVAFVVRGGGNNNIIQKWEVQRKGGAGAGSGSVVAYVTSSGSLALSGTLLSDRATDLGWAVVAGANAACNTTCAHACVFGVNTAATEADIVACTDNTADECLCAGPN